MNLPRITVITPSYNQAQYLEQTIISVLSQHYPNLEYIIVDGGSTDGSVDIIRNYSSYLAWWVSESDKGQTFAINKGIKSSTGDLICWINSDDLLSPNSLWRIAEEFSSYPEKMAVYGDATFIDKSGKFLQNYDSGEFSMERLVRYNFIPQPSVFFRRELLDTIGFLDETLHYAMDYDFWIRITSRYNLVHIPDTISQFRFHNSTKTSQGRLHFSLDIIHIYQKIIFDKEMSIDIRELILSSCIWRILEVSYLIEKDNCILKTVLNDSHIIENFSEFQKKTSNLFHLFIERKISSSFITQFENELSLIYCSIISDEHSFIMNIRREKWIKKQYQRSLKILFLMTKEKKYCQSLKISLLIGLHNPSIIINKGLFHDICSYLLPRKNTQIPS